MRSYGARGVTSGRLVLEMGNLIGAQGITPDIECEIPAKTVLVARKQGINECSNRIMSFEEFESSDTTPKGNFHLTANSLRSLATGDIHRSNGLG